MAVVLSVSDVEKIPLFSQYMGLLNVHNNYSFSLNHMKQLIIAYQDFYMKLKHILLPKNAHTHTHTHTDYAPF